MKFEVLYEQSLALWPVEIEIYDGERSEDYQNITFLRLSLTYDKADAEAKGFGEWYELITWIIFKNLHSIATINFKRRLQTITQAQLDPTQVKADFLANLKLAGYEDMLAEFEQNNG
jgi:hypothetical protein